jgi:hypothetical protein
MRILRQQAGMTAIATIAVIILVAFIAFLALKLIPVYLEYFSVVSSVNSLEDDPDLGSKSKAAVQELLKRRFEINDVKRVKPENVKVTRSGHRSESHTYWKYRFNRVIREAGGVPLVTIENNRNTPAKLAGQIAVRQHQGLHIAISSTPDRGGLHHG